MENEEYQEMKQWMGAMQDQLDRIELTLMRPLFDRVVEGREIEEHVYYVIGGWSVGSRLDGSPYIALFATHPGLNNRIVKVYPEAWHQLPPFVDTKNLPPPSRYEKKEDLQREGHYQECPSFEILIIRRPGKEKGSQPEKRLFGVLRILGDTSHYVKGAGRNMPAKSSAGNGNPPPPSKRGDPPTTGATPDWKKIGLSSATAKDFCHALYMHCEVAGHGIYRDGDDVKMIAERLLKDRERNWAGVMKDGGRGVLWAALLLYSAKRFENRGHETLETKKEAYEMAYIETKTL